MSYILDALKKSDQERKRGEVPTITSVNADASPNVGETKRIGLKIAAGGFALGVAVIAGIMFMVGGDETPQPTSTNIAVNEVPSSAPQPDEVPVAKAETAQTTERSVEPKPITKPQPDKTSTLETVPKIEPKPTTAKQPEKPSPIVAANPVDANIPKPDPAATEAPPPASQPVNNVSKAPAPKRVPGSTIAPAPTPTPETKETKIANALKTQKPAPKLPPLDGATAHFDRGWDSMDRGLFNQAVADFSIAVEMEPGFADGWFALGWAQEKNSQDDEAIASYGRAINVKADHAGALFSRGYLQLFSDNPLGATRDFNAAANLAKNDFRIYIHAWTYIAKSKTGIDGVGDLKTNSRNDDLSSWPGHIVRYYAGELNESEVIQFIEDAGQPDLQERRCAGYFFLGEYALLQGDGAKARDYFEKSLATGVVKLRQFDAARRELAKLAK
ncbi:MAG: hypothetical protein OEX17_01690 [Rhodospirillaceae bacterium]|nr:hypothetical protein [Rhodospirillaceae bacterium]